MIQKKVKICKTHGNCHYDNKALIQRNFMILTKFENKLHNRVLLKMGQSWPQSVRGIVLNLRQNQWTVQGSRV